MLAMGVLFGIIAIIGFMWLYYSRSFKQAEVLLFQKGSLLTNQSRYLVCPEVWKCTGQKWRISRVLQN